MKEENTKIFDLHADFCQVLANPKRLMVIALLSKREMSVGEISQITDTRISNMSQHLRVLRARNIVTTRKEGQTVYYRLSDPRLPAACLLIRSVLLDSLKRRGEIAQEIDLADMVVE